VSKRNNKIILETLLSGADKTLEQKLALFAWLNLGLVESLVEQQLRPIDAVRIFFHGENCLFVRKGLADHTADEIMSRGVQLADVFDVLPPDEAQLRFEEQLKQIRDLSLAILEQKQLAA
jgi:hypothetical protein